MPLEPLQNPIGFGASDFIEFGFAALCVLLTIFWKPWITPAARKLASRPIWAMLLLAFLPIVLRLLLLPNHPIPSPDLYDEFGHLLVADTLRHFRFANPTHPFHRFFETFFVLQQPTYSSIYPVGPGLALAIGVLIAGTPWAGVLLAVGGFCALCYWMLRGWTTPEWALLGGLLAVLEFGPLCQWTNTYWGGALPAAGGCLVFGSLPRLREYGRTRDAILLGLGLSIHILTRQFESIFLFLSVLLFFIPRRRPSLRLFSIAALTLAPALAITLLQNKQVTGSWTTLPEALGQYQYGVPSALTFQSDPIPHRDLTPQQAMDYKRQMAFKGVPSETLGSYLLRLEYRVRYYRFFFLVPLYLALPFFLAQLREYKYAWLVITAALFVLGVNFFPAFQFHYVAAITCILILMAILGLQRISTFSGGPLAARLLIFLCAAHFLFWYALHVFDGARRYETWDVINHQNPERRIAVNRQLAKLTGKQLVFVRYGSRHVFQDEWVYNAADIDASRVVWARDLGDEENRALVHYYPDRTVWILETDTSDLQLERYNPAPPVFQPGANPFVPIPKAR